MNKKIITKKKKNNFKLYITPKKQRVNKHRDKKIKQKRTKILNFEQYNFLESKSKSKSKFKE